MPRRSRLFSLSSLARAYQRNLKAFARAAGAASKPVRVKAVSKLRAAPRKSAVAPVPSTARTPRAATKPVPLRGEWISGVAPGPAGARRFHAYVPSGLALRPGEKLYEELLIGGNPSSTVHPRIMKAHEEFIPWAEFKAKLNALEMALNVNDVGEIRLMMQQLVAGYTPSDEIVDWVYLEQEADA